MKTFLIAGLAAVAFYCAPALAARVKAPPAPAPAPMFNWTGFYIGADVGGFRGDAHVLVNDDPCCTAKLNPKGFLYGGHAGYRWQNQSPVVLGIEGDIWGIDGSTNEVANTDHPIGDTLRATAGGSLRLQAGYALDRLLFYGTGGLAIIHVKGCTIEFFPGPCEAGDTFSGNRTGWTAGGGIDYAVTQNWTARIEYLYADYGSHDYPTPSFVPPSVLGVHNFDTTSIRVGISWKVP